MSVTEERFREVLGHLAGGVSVVTTREPAGDPCGLTATAVCSVSLRPPLVLVSIERTTNTHRCLRAAGFYAVNLLGGGDAEIARRFATESDGKFGGVAYREGTTGAPLLEEGLGYCDCSVVRRVPAGDHTIFIGEVEEASLRDRSGRAPLVYHRGDYRVLPLDSHDSPAG